MPPYTFAPFRSTLLGPTAHPSALRLGAIPSSHTPVRNFRAWWPLTRLTREPGLPPCPPYPYGPQLNFKEADEGLYGGIRPQSGNKVSKGKNKGKTRRKWHPNVRIEDIPSEALEATLSIKITAACMRTIRKCGGLDQYLLGDKPARIKELGLFGWALRWRVMNAESTKARLHSQRQELGLIPVSVVEVPKPLTFRQDIRKNKQLREEVLMEQERQWQALREKDERFQRHIKSRWEKAEPEDVVPPVFNAQVFDKAISQPRSSSRAP